MSCRNPSAWVTVLRVSGWSIFINKDGDPPAHVHVYGQGGEAKIDLAALNDDPALANSKGLKPPDIRRVMATVPEHHHFLLERREEIHG